MIVADVILLAIVLGLGGFGLGVLVSRYTRHKAEQSTMFQDIRNALFSNDKNAIENVIVLYEGRIDNRMRDALKKRAATLEYEKDSAALGLPGRDGG